MKAALANTSCVGSANATPLVEQGIRETVHENEILLNKLFDLQEQLEHQHEWRKAVVESSLFHKKQLPKEFENENEILTAQLLSTQEKLETIQSSYQSLLEKHKLQTEKLRTLINSLPNYWGAGFFEVKESVSANAGKIIEWKFENVNFGGRLISHLSFTTELIGTQVNLKIERSTRGSGQPCPLLRWPDSYALNDFLPCIPVLGPSNQGSNAAISELGASDWIFLKDLVEKLVGYVKKPDEHAPELINSSALLSGLKSLNSTLKAWPAKLRYDSVDIVEIGSRAHYAGLSFNMTNLSFGDNSWPSINYILSNVNNRDTKFENSPRLEFPDSSSKSGLISWYAERDDEHGKRLELRFVQPNTMDIQVWNSLKGSDQILIAAIVSLMPSILVTCNHHYILNNNSRLDWVALATSIKENLAHNLIPPHSTVTNR